MTRLSRFFAIVTLVVSTGAMLTASFDAEARRAGGGKSFGRQSTNVTQQRQAVTPPTAANANTAQRAAAPAAAAGAAGAGAAAKSGMSRWLGPIAGIAAGLGIAALLSHLGLSGAFLELISSMLLIGLLAFAVIFIFRRLRGGAARPAMQQAGAGNGGNGLNRQGDTQPLWRQSSEPAAAAPVAAAAAAPLETVPAAPVDESWFIPGDFDTATFLAQAKKQFATIQGIWDRGAIDELTEYLTDDLIAELKPQMMGREDGGKTEIVLLNAELLGIEKVQDGYLASVRYSGMLRESVGSEAFRFEEVWNLFKADGQGWLLAGIQQIPVEHAS
ncbi:Tim44 domain-containing protein [Paracandidimonas soli]|uniref:Putative lipid-binding transport protein (Tim44 family) n=1 Tax=Paracandidimonas soli TaxID=1917182 RepID=A0A4R3UV02_9BURK|nr:TIM44-like domain-containing protein [Paracandidimonas soli]TCU95956.1 putative lipid-binding transport protein (Tim44 family) [Paracandidimonas soli]